MVVDAAVFESSLFRQGNALLGGFVVVLVMYRFASSPMGLVGRRNLLDGDVRSSAGESTTFRLLNFRPRCDFCELGS